MISAVQAFIDAAEAGDRAKATSWLECLPPWQVDLRWEDFAPHCPSLRRPALLPRPGNALNVEIGAPMARCLSRPPPQWPATKAAMGLRWIASGGAATVFGLCSRSGCPRARAEAGR